MDDADFWQQQEQELHQQWLEEQDRISQGLASTRNAGSQCGERFREGKDDEQKQPDRNEQQPLHTLV